MPIPAGGLVYAGGDEPTYDMKVEAAFGADLTADPDTWSWTDLSARLRAEPIRIRAGRSSGASIVSPSTCSLVLDNPDGALTPGHPASEYWPNVQLGTPLRVRVQWDGVWYDRFSGFADQWEPKFQPITAGQADSYVRVTASGILRRLTQGTSPSRSPMRRSMAASGALAYWPVEDGFAAEQVASAFPGHAPLTITGPTPKFDDIEAWTEGRGYEVRYGTAALADVSGGSVLSASVPASVTAATAAGWTAAVALDIPDGTLATNLVLLEVETTGGTFSRWQLLITPTSHTQVVAYTSDGAATTVIDSSGRTISMSAHNFAVWQSGGTIQVGWEYNSVFGYRATGSVAGTLGGVTSVKVNAAGTTSPIPILAGHIALWAGHDLRAVDRHDGPMFLALFGYEWTNIDTGLSAPTGEPATVRLARLLAEDGITVDMPPVDSVYQVMMGRQPVGSAMDLYRECADADIGILYESGWGLGYLPRQYRYNRPVDLTVDLATYAVSGGSSDVLSPILDDEGIRNELTVSRRDGSSVVVVDEDSQRRNGVYDDEIELNLASDGDLADQAAWRLYLAGRRAS